MPRQRTHDAAGAAPEDATAVPRPTAVVLADSFTSDFKPVSLEWPRCLLPVAGVAIIDYTVEFLQHNGIVDIVVVTVAHEDVFAEYLDRRWGGGGSALSLRHVHAAGCASYVEMLQFLHRADVAPAGGDVILMHGDVIANSVDLAGMWERHCARRRRDPAVLVTTVLKEQPTAMVEAREDLVKTSLLRHYEKSIAQQQRTEQKRLNSLFGLGSDPDGDNTTIGDNNRCPTISEATRYPGIEAIQHSLATVGEERATAVMDANTNLLLQYRPWQGIAAPDAQVGWLAQPLREGGRGDHFKLMLTLLPTYPALRIRTDVCETGILICAAEFLALFQPGIHHHDLQVDVKAVKDQASCVAALLSHSSTHNHDHANAGAGGGGAHPPRRVYADVIPAYRFVRRVRTFDQYLDITRSVVGGWSHPLTPDAGFALHQWQSLSSPEPTTFIDTTATIGVGATIGRCSSIAPEVTIGDGCTIATSVVGRGSRVGKHATIRDAVLWEGVRVGTGATVDGAVLCDNVVVGDYSTVEPGCVLSFGVRVAPHTTVARDTRVTRMCVPRATGTPPPGLATPPIASLQPGDLGGRRSGQTPPARGRRGAGKRGSPLASLGRGPATPVMDTAPGGAFPSSRAAAGGPAATRSQSGEMYITHGESDADVVGEGGLGRVYDFPTLGMVLDFHRLSLPQDEDASSSVSLLADSDRDTDEGDIPMGNVDPEFDNEVLATLRSATVDDALDATVRLDHVVLAINTSKFAYDADVVDCCKAALLALLEMAETDAEADEAVDPQRAFLRLLRDWRKVFLVLRCSDLESQKQEAAGETTNQDQIEKEILITLVEWSTHHQHLRMHFGNYVHALYDADVLSEEVILEWEQEKVREQQQGRLSVLDDTLLRTCRQLLAMLR